MDDKLGSSKAVSVANKQLTKTCVVVTCVFVITLGKNMYTHPAIDVNTHQPSTETPRLFNY